MGSSYLKILVYGAGVIGCIFAAKLSLSGENVTILARGKRRQEIEQSGIVLRHPRTGTTEVAEVELIDTLTPEMVYDYIFVVMRRNQVDAVLPALVQNRSKNIVYIVNTAAGYDKLKDAVGAERVLVGFPAAGGERKDGVGELFCLRRNGEDNSDDYVCRACRSTDGACTPGHSNV